MSGLSRPPSEGRVRSWTAAVLLAFAPFAPVAAQVASPSEAPKPLQPVYRLEIPDDLSILPAEGAQVDVPILLQHNGQGSYNLFNIGLDYDELLLRFGGEGNVSLDGAIGIEVDSVYHDPVNGYLSFDIEFDPGAAIDSQEPLVWLTFGVAFSTFARPQDDHYSNSTTATIELEHAYASQLEKGARSDPPVITTATGRVLIYLRDTIELGSAEMSPHTQEIRIPVYVTHLGRATHAFEMLLDYDVRYLSFVDLTLVSEMTQPHGEVDWYSKSGEIPADGADPDLASISLRFPGGIYPEMKREHLIDLHFVYDAAAGVPERGFLTLEPFFGPDPFVALRSDRSAQLHAGDLFFVTPPFVRGDADSSGARGGPAVDVRDAFAILDASLLSGLDSLPCLEAADANDNGRVNMADTVYLLNYLFTGGTPPPHPFPGRGSDLAPDFGCESYGPPYFSHR